MPPATTARPYSSPKLSTNRAEPLELSSELDESVGSAEPPPKPVYTAPSDAVDAAPSPVAVAVMDVIVDVLILVGSWAPHG
jgi:hypothetical protein